MKCHGTDDGSTTGTDAAPQPRRFGGHGLLMLACCLAPLAVILAIGVFGIPGSSLLSFAAVLICPLMMVFMMRGMGHGSAQPSASNTQAKVQE